MFFVVLVVHCVLVERLCSVVVVFAVDVVVSVVLCICLVAGVWGMRMIVLLVPGTLLLVLGGGCRRPVVVVVGCGIDTLPASSSILVRRGTGQKLESFLRMNDSFWKMCRFVLYYRTWSLWAAVTFLGARLQVGKQCT